MPERVLPEPVSPVMSQPRQKSSRVHAKPFSRTINLLLADLALRGGRVSGDGGENHRHNPRGRHGQKKKCAGRHQQRQASGDVI